jgi:hypothetical protein
MRLLESIAHAPACVARHLRQTTQGTGERHRALIGSTLAPGPADPSMSTGETS